MYVLYYLIQKDKKQLTLESNTSVEKIKKRHGINNVYVIGQYTTKKRAQEQLRLLANARRIRGEKQGKIKKKPPVSIAPR